MKVSVNINVSDDMIQSLIDTPLYTDLKNNPELKNAFRLGFGHALNFIGVDIESIIALQKRLDLLTKR